MAKTTPTPAKNQSLAEMDAALADPKLYVHDPAKAAELGRRRESVQARVDAAETEWLAAGEAYEAALATA